MSRTTERFIRLFEDLAGEVNRRAGLPTSHQVEIERAAQRDGAVRKAASLLRYVRDVRNTLQRPRHGANGHAVQVAEPFLAEVEALLRYLQNPPTAGTVGVARKEITTAGLDDELGDLAGTMKRFGFSHLTDPQRA